MYEFNRLQTIMETLSEQKSISVQELAKMLYVSEATVRRDLNALEKQGQVRRVFGGVVLMENNIRTASFHGRSTKDTALEKMAQLAAEHVKNGDTIMLDASSSACAIIPYLKRFRNLTVITNSNVSTAGLQDLEAHVYITGGFMPRHSQGYVGAYAESMLRNFKANTFFFSCAGLAMDGRISDATSDENAIHKVMLRQSQKHILLCDSPKFGLDYCYTIAEMDDIDVLISDAPFTGVGREKQYL
ncbi:MAG: DeoR/GlpR transcriptional regulator [Clostridiales bacterium]|nr:DeoR/GlpR transcriptional regulator [Clostridiales bacterium]